MDHVLRSHDELDVAAHGNALAYPWKHYIGGHLGTNREEWSDVEARFLGIGFDRVYSTESRPAGIIEDLKKDLQARHLMS